jgi:hypothetical protein
MMAFFVGSKALIMRFRVSDPYPEGNPETGKRGLFRIAHKPLRTTQPYLRAQ